MKKNRKTTKIFLKSLDKIKERLLFFQYKYDTKQTWQAIKKIIGKQKKKSDSQTKAIKTKQEITGKESEFAKGFNKYFTDVGTELVKIIPIVSKDVSIYLPQCNAFMDH